MSTSALPAKELRLIFSQIRFQQLDEFPLASSSKENHQGICFMDSKFLFRVNKKEKKKKVV